MSSSMPGLVGMSEQTRGFIAMVRDYMRDQPQLNRLIDGYESNDRQIAWALLDALSRFNGTPPFLGTSSLDNLLAYNQHYLLTRMTVCSVLESVALLQTRNQVDYNTGGTTVALNNKTPLLLNWIQMLRASTDQDIVRVKVAMNVAQCLDGGVSGVLSELWAVNGLYSSYN